MQSEVMMVTSTWATWRCLIPSLTSGWWKLQWTPRGNQWPGRLYSYCICSHSLGKKRQNLLCTALYFALFTVFIGTIYCVLHQPSTVFFMWTLLYCCFFNWILSTLLIWRAVQSMFLQFQLSKQHSFIFFFLIINQINFHSNFIKNWHYFECI